MRVILVVLTSHFSNSVVQESKIVLYGAVIKIFLDFNFLIASTTILDLPTLGETYIIPLNLF